jgi:hypothetical protein
MNPAIRTNGTKNTGITCTMVGTVLAKVPMSSPKEFPVIAFQRQNSLKIRNIVQVSSIFKK